MEKDIGKKKLEQHPDVFADIFNSLLFHGEDFIKASDLTLVPTEDFLDVMSKIGTDKRYKEIKETIIERPEKEEVTMCLIAEELENKGIEKGIEQGIEQGIKDGINKTIEILKDMEIPMDEIKQRVAKKYNMTQEQIEEIMNE